MAKPFVALAVTCLAERDGWIHPDLALFLLEWASKSIGPVHFVRNYRPHHNARNQAAEMFMKGGQGWLLMVDNDTVPPRGALELIKHLDGRDIVAVPYPFYQIKDGKFSVRDCVFQGSAAKGLEPFNVTGAGFQEIVACGGGCVFVHRKVFEKLAQPWFRPTTNPHDPGEDIDFCMRTRQAGFKIWTTADYGRAEHFKTIPLSHLY
jgi:hypothetical protein